MSFTSSFKSFLGKFGVAIVSAVSAAIANGLTSDVIDLAKKWVKIAAQKELDDTKKREFVVNILVGKRVPESIARLAVELAYQAVKKELDSVTTSGSAVNILD